MHVSRKNTLPSVQDSVFRLQRRRCVLFHYDARHRRALEELRAAFLLRREVPLLTGLLALSELLVAIRDRTIVFHMSFQDWHLLIRTDVDRYTSLGAGTRWRFPATHPPATSTPQRARILYTCGSTKRGIESDVTFDRTISW